MFGFKKQLAALQARMTILETAISVELPMLRDEIAKLKEVQRPTPEDAEQARLEAEQQRIIQETIANILSYSIETAYNSRGNKLNA